MAVHSRCMGCGRHAPPSAAKVGNSSAAAEAGFSKEGSPCASAAQPVPASLGCDGHHASGFRVRLYRKEQRGNTDRRRKRGHVGVGGGGGGRGVGGGEGGRGGGGRGGGGVGRGGVGGGGGGGGGGDKGGGEAESSKSTVVGQEWSERAARGQGSEARTWSALHDKLLRRHRPCP